MNKTKIILASIGGVALLAALVLAYLVWDALSAKGEAQETLEEATSAAERLTSAAVYPGPAGVKAHEANRAAYVAWRTNTLALAARGDVAFEKTTPPAFKDFLVSDARRLAELPGAAEGKLVKKDFTFGFKSYISGGVLPSAADLPRLQREWHDVSLVVGMLAESGVLEIVDLTMGKAPAAAAAPAAETPKSRKQKRRQQAAKPAAAAAPEEEPGEMRVTSFKVEFLARHDAIVRALNAFLVSPRFVVVDTLAFVREKDDLQEALGGAKQEEQKPSRRPRRNEKAEKKDEEKKSGFVADPLKVSPYKVTMQIAVCDFRSQEPAKVEAGASAKEAK